MAQKVEVLLIDDIDGGDATETITFGLDGKSYEIDLNDKNAKKLRDFLEPYLKGGRKAGGRVATVGARSRTTAASSSEDTAKIRAWAKETGVEVSARGRIPVSVREAFAAAHA